MLGTHGSSERKKLFILPVSSFTQKENSRKGRISLCLPQVILLILQGKESLSLNTSLSIISSNDTVKCKVSITYYLAASLNAVSFHHWHYAERVSSTPATEIHWILLWLMKSSSMLLLFVLDVKNVEADEFSWISCNLLRFAAKKVNNPLT